MQILISNKKTEDLAVVLARLYDVVHCRDLADKYVKGACSNDLYIVNTLRDLLALSIDDKRPVYVSANCISELLQETSILLSRYEALQRDFDELHDKQCKQSKFRQLCHRLKAFLK